MAKVEERHRKAAQTWAASADVVVMPREVNAYAKALADADARVVAWLRLFDDEHTGEAFANDMERGSHYE